MTEMDRVSLGFTGSRHGMTSNQYQSFRDLLALFPMKDFHFGDCLGADKQAFNYLVKSFGDDVWTVSHPPSGDSFRAYCVAQMILPSKPYLERNHDIVDACDILIATPRNPDEHAEPRSGTWATIRYARKQGKPRIIILPNGNRRIGFSVVA